MVNTFLLGISVATVVIWLAQELVGRRRMQAALTWCAQKKTAQDADALIEQAVPGWLENSYRLVLVAWFGWLGLVFFTRDGDFAVALVVLTGVAGLISGIDLLLQRRRRLFVEQGNVAAYLRYFVGEQHLRLKHTFGEFFPIAEQARSFFPVLMVVLVLRSFIVEPFQIPSASMVPTLEVGDYILVNKFSYGLRLPVVGTKILEVGEPERGDVMVFFPPHDKRYFIKRVVGLPGDKIRYERNKLYINDELVAQELLSEMPPMRPVIQKIRENLLGVEHHIHHDLRISRDPFEAVVKPGHYFMMGDNRDNSSDSRIWGQVPEHLIVGKAFAIWMHWPKVTQLPRFTRFGAIE